MFTWEWLTETFVYEDGWLYLRSTGKVRGTFKARYVKMTIQGREYYMHRLVWFYHNKTWPIQIDHADGNGFNNKIENLRECNQSQNIANANYGDMRGIEQRGGSFRVRLKINGQRISYGSYQELAEAMKVRNEAYLKAFGEFSFFG